MTGTSTPGNERGDARRGSQSGHYTQTTIKNEKNRGHNQGTGQRTCKRWRRQVLPVFGPVCVPPCSRDEPTSVRCFRQPPSIHQETTTTVAVVGNSTTIFRSSPTDPIKMAVERVCLVPSTLTRISSPFLITSLLVQILILSSPLSQRLSSNWAFGFPRMPR